MMANIFRFNKEKTHMGKKKHRKEAGIKSSALSRRAESHHRALPLGADLRTYLL